MLNFYNLFRLSLQSEEKLYVSLGSNFYTLILDA